MQEAASEIERVSSSKQRLIGNLLSRLAIVYYSVISWCLVSIQLASMNFRIVRYLAENIFCTLVRIYSIGGAVNVN